MRCHYGFFGLVRASTKVRVQDSIELLVRRRVPVLFVRIDLGHPDCRRVLSASSGTCLGDPVKTGIRWRIQLFPLLGRLEFLVGWLLC